MKTDPTGHVVLEGDGSYSKIFTVTIDGADLVARKVRATWFGGADDPYDSGSTASGISTKTHPNILGCSLPMSGCHCPSTEGSPLPKLPWGTRVKVYNRANSRIVYLQLIDIGPAKPPHAHAGIDLTQAAFLELGGDLKEGEIFVDWRIEGGAGYAHL